VNLGWPGGKKFARPHLKGKNAGHGGMNLSFRLWREMQNRRMVVQATLSKKQDPISKITTTKRAVDMV
jgi:hypothetical protein